MSTTLQESLIEFLDTSRRLWNEYQQVGPGGMDVADFPPLAAVAQDLLRHLEAEGGLASEDDPLPIAVERIVDLARRCACTTQGLSFVSGEAGLIPRQDQHAAFESSLQRLADYQRTLS